MFVVEIEPYDRAKELLKLRLSTNTGLETILTINPYDCFSKYILNDPNLISLDILYFTSIIYAIDKLIPRKEANDNWSRDITVSIPVSDKRLWNTAIEPLKLALDFLTSDNWILLFEEIQEPYYVNKYQRLFPNEYFSTVCLFSGGLDSLAGVIDTIEKEDNVLLVSHRDKTGASSKIQEPLIRNIKDAYLDKNIEQSVFHVYTNNSSEPTTRGRSILFHGLALFHAINLELKEVIASENGVISINLPLTPSRTCSNSTKTMHPYFLKMFQEALTLLNIDVQINNPYLLKTKGEMLLENRNPQLIKELATKTLSCSKGGGHTNGWNRKSYNCGYCIPCTIRRASIHKFDNLLDKNDDYGHALNGIEINLREKKKRLDLLALSYFFKRNLSHKELKREINLMARLDNTTEVANMLERGYAEIKEYIMAKGDSSVKRLFS